MLELIIVYLSVLAIISLRRKLVQNIVMSSVHNFVSLESLY